MKKNAWTLCLVILTVSVLGCGASKKELLYQRGPMPFNGNFDGVYQSDFGRLELSVESGDQVVGLYEKDDKYGRLEGKVKDNLLFFTWTQWDEGMKGKARETTGKGVFQYMVDEYPTDAGAKQRHWLKGFWSYGREVPTNPWNAYKLSKKAKKKLKPFDPDAGVGKMQDDAYDAAGFQDVSGGGGETGGDDMGGGDMGGGGSESAPESSAPAPQDDESGGDVDLF